MRIGTFSMMWRSLTSRSSSSSFNTSFSYSTIAVDPTAGGRDGSPDFYSANANCMFASFGLLSGRRLLLQLLHPNCSRYLSPDDLASLNLSIPSLSAGADSLTKSEKESQREERSGKEDAESDEEGTAPESVEKTSEGGKKDPSLRRRELLVNSGLAENLVDICIESTRELLQSNFGKEIIYEVATGGSSGILYQTLNDKLKNLHEAIASLAAEPKSEESEEEHVLENFHSSHTIRKLVLDCPEFASTLWKKAFEGKCESWAQGHSSKVLCAFWETLDSKVHELAEEELQPLIESGVLKIPETKQSANEGRFANCGRKSKDYKLACFSW
ncbi:hypothetical protein SLE2022_319800 [Rubroshorea leprosula]